METGDLVRHPRSGLHYLHVFPRSRVFDEVRQCHEVAARRLRWLSTELSDVYVPLIEAPAVAVIFWQHAHLETLRLRIFRKALHYCEATGPSDNLIENQAQFRRLMFEQLPMYDVVFGHTPAAVQVLSSWGAKAALAPIGYDPEVMGTPSWDTPKTHDAAFYGTRVGRREWAVEALMNRLGKRLLVFSDYGAARKQALDGVNAVVHVNHSEDRSFPTFRLFQAAASAAALITEEADAWPCLPGRHFVQVPKATPSSAEAFVESVDKALASPALRIVARRAHKHLAAYTVERCMEEFVIPSLGTA